MDATNLRMLIELATVARDAAAAQRAQSSSAVEAARHQLAALRGYATDYQQRGQATLCQGADIAAQNNLRAFVAKLDRAIVQQENEVTRREQVLASAERGYTEAQRKLKSLQALQVRSDERSRQMAQRREQKLLDEIAQGMGSARSLTASGW